MLPLNLYPNIMSNICGDAAPKNKRLLKVLLWLAGILCYYFFFQLFYNAIAYREAFHYTSLKDAAIGFSINFSMILMIFAGIYFVVFHLYNKRFGAGKILIDTVCVACWVLISPIPYIIFNRVFLHREPHIDWAGVSFNGFFIFLGVEMVCYVLNYRNALSDIEEERRKKMEYKYDALKKQVYPHFLFNSLGLINALIDINKDKAKECIGSLSEMYRYVVGNESGEPVGLEDELKFLHAFLGVLETRYEGLEIHYYGIGNIPRGKKMIPFTLQILMENVVKHNIVSSDGQLHVVLRIEQESITVANERKLRPHSNGTGVGLKYLRDIYWLHGKRILIDMTEIEFKVTVPYLD